MPYIWSSFELGHGKGEYDGVDACVKRALVKGKLNILGAELLNTHSIVNWCSSTLSYGDS